MRRRAPSLVGAMMRRTAYAASGPGLWSGASAGTSIEAPARPVGIAGAQSGVIVNLDLSGMAVSLKR